MIQVPPQTFIDIGRKSNRIQCLAYTRMLFLPSKVHIAWVFFGVYIPTNPPPPPLPPTYHMALRSVHKFLSMCDHPFGPYTLFFFLGEGEFFLLFYHVQILLKTNSLSLSLSLEEYLNAYFSHNNCKKTKNNNNIMKLDTCKTT